MIRLDPHSDCSNFANSQLNKQSGRSSTPLRTGTPNTVGSGFQKLISNLDEDTSQTLVSNDIVLSKPQAEVEYFSHQTIAPFRSDEIPINVKQMGNLTKENTFKKPKSVFKDWKQNTTKTLASCAEHDLKHWKIPNMPMFKSNPEEYDQVKQLIEQYIEHLMIVHIHYASEGNFPYAAAFNVS